VEPAGSVTSQRRQPKAVATTLHLERRNVLILLVAGGLAMAAAMGLADMAGYSRLVDVRVPETQFATSRCGFVFVDEASEHVSAPNTVESDDGF
jgi:hypothetical protein